MKVLLICVGSRGDAEPFCALAAKLLAENHQVEFFLQPELQKLAPSSSSSSSDNSINTNTNINIHTLPFGQMDFYKFVGNPSHGKDHENPRVKFVGIVTDVIGELVLPCCKDVLEVAISTQCDMIVTSALARNLGFCVSKKLNIPSCLIHLQPLVPTKDFPHYSQTDDILKCLTATTTTTEESQSSDANFQTYQELEKYQYEFLEERLDKVYEAMDLPKLEFEELSKMLQGNDSKTALCNAFYSPELLPHPIDAGPYCYNVGALADHYIPKDFEPDMELQAFLQAERPICVGYGSMPFTKASLLLQALKMSGRKAVLVGDALKLPTDGDVDIDSDWIQTHIRQVSGIPYAWLLPQCQMMLCHGGAGVVHATLRAGIPCVISPLMGDQFFFSRLLTAKGLGCPAGASLPTVTQDEFVQAIATATDCITAARTFGETIRAQPLGGVDQMYTILQQMVDTDQSIFPEALLYCQSRSRNQARPK